MKSPDFETSPTSVLPSWGPYASNLVSAKSLHPAARVLPTPPKREGEGAEDSVGALIRADLCSLSDLDWRGYTYHMIGPVGKLNQGVKKSGYQKGWEIDLNEVVCMNLIAAGSFGTVYYGTYRGKDVAVKFLNPPPQLSKDDINELTASFESEVGVWQGLSHPNIVQFYGASSSRGVEGQVPRIPIRAIVSEFVPGGTVKGLLKKQRRQPWRVIVKIARGIAEGLHYMHSHGIVHRDVKSDNLLLDVNGDVKIADFGVARVEAENPMDMTCHTGTVRWMAPEIIDYQPYTRKVDVYSFGIVLWELCTGDHPFRELTTVQLAIQVVKRGRRPQIPEYCPRDLANLMRRCWDQNPSKRPEFAHVIKDLDRVEKGLGVEKDTRPALQKLCGACFGGGKVKE